MRLLRRGKSLLRALAIALIAGIAIEGGLMMAVFLCGQRTAQPRPADAIIVLGARVMPDGRMSTTLFHRVKVGFELYEQGYAPYMIVCGARGRDEPVSEAEAMAQYLTGRGVPQDKVLLDAQSGDTIENLANARRLMEQNGLSTAIVVTSDYHLTRALWICGDLDIDAQGVPAPGQLRWIKRMASRFRESLSWINYFLGGALKNWFGR